jgi:hypothetical protein
MRMNLLGNIRSRRGKYAGIFPAGFQEFLDRRILPQFLDRLPRKRKVRLLLYCWESAWSPALRLQEFSCLKAGLQALFRR